jgi:hypothetical protein
MNKKQTNRATIDHVHPNKIDLAQNLQKNKPWHGFSDQTDAAADRQLIPDFNSEVVGICENRDRGRGAR